MKSIHLKKIRQILKALADDTRLRILNLLFEKELTVKAICKILNISQSAASKHLTRLRLLKMVIDRREGNFVYYRLNLDLKENKIIQFIFSEFSNLMF